MSQEQKYRVELQASTRPPDLVTPPLDATPSEKQVEQPMPAESTEESTKPEGTEGSEEPTEEMADAGNNNEQEKPPKTPASSERTTIKKRVRRRRTRLVNVEEILPRPSIWPLVLAVSVALTLFGIIVQPILCAVGLILVIVSVVFWALERR